MKVLVTGGNGYIGSHTVVDLIDNGFEPICADNLSRSRKEMWAGVQQAAKQEIPLYEIDLSDKVAVQQLFEERGDIGAVIHFAAYKYVGESVKDPLLYYENNLNSLVNLLSCVNKHKVKHFVFSSSCTVYGNPEKLPVSEKSPVVSPQSPYGATKQMSEQIITDFSHNSDCRFTLLRYFNPIGAHPSALIGELSNGRPENIMPILLETADGTRASMTVFGSDYPTRDGTCIRDYIHVMDIANAHTKALQYMQKDTKPEKVQVFNLGSGEGVTVLELISAFEKASGKKLNWEMGDRRPGDVVAVYADNRKAKEQLNWQLQYSLEDMMETAWKWQQKLDS